MLCIPQNTVEAAHSDICGSLFEKVIKCFPIYSYGPVTPGSYIPVPCNIFFVKTSHLRIGSQHQSL